MTVKGKRLWIAVLADTKKSPSTLPCQPSTNTLRRGCHLPPYWKVTKPGFPLTFEHFPHPSLSRLYPNSPPTRCLNPTYSVVPIDWSYSDSSVSIIYLSVDFCSARRVRLVDRHSEYLRALSRLHLFRPAETKNKTPS